MLVLGDNSVGKLPATKIREYWPELPDGALVPDYAGIRPKLQGPNDPPRDFTMQCSSDHSIRGLVNFFGIESPGLTASLALAKMCADSLVPC